MARINPGDIAIFSLTGTVKSTGEIFETSDERVAKQHKIYNNREKYGNRLIVFGKNMVFKKIEETLSKMDSGDENTVELGHAEAFGKRDNNMIRIMPMREFRNRNINPAPNNYVNIDNYIAKVVSANSGRVVLDFNHPLAGSDVIYTVKLIKIISGLQEKAEAFASHYGIECTAQIDKDQIKITAKKLNNEISYHGRKKTLVDALFIFLDAKKVVFQEEYEPPKKEAAENAKPPAEQKEKKRE